VNPPDPSAGGPMSFEAFEPARYAMGDTVRFAERMDLIAMEPRGDLTSTGYALANPGEEYLVLQPSEAADPFTVRVGSGTYGAEWFNIGGRETVPAEDVTVEGSEPITVRTPFEEAGVVHLRRAGG
jgi:hypothetical protein